MILNGITTNISNAHTMSLVCQAQVVPVSVLKGKPDLTLNDVGLAGSRHLRLVRTVRCGLTTISHHRRALRRLTRSNLLQISGIIFADAVIRGKGTVRDSDMPFVNRHEELWDLFKVNAENMALLRAAGESIYNFRPYRLLFCVLVCDASRETVAGAETFVYSCV